MSAPTHTYNPRTAGFLRRPAGRESVWVNGYGPCRACGLPRNAHPFIFRPGPPPLNPPVAGGRLFAEQETTVIENPDYQP